MKKIDMKRVLQLGTLLMLPAIFCSFENNSDDNLLRFTEILLYSISSASIFTLTYNHLTVETIRNSVNNYPRKVTDYELIVKLLMLTDLSKDVIADYQWEITKIKDNEYQIDGVHPVAKRIIIFKKYNYFR